MDLNPAYYPNWDLKFKMVRSSKVFVLPNGNLVLGHGTYVSIYDWQKKIIIKTLVSISQNPEVFGRLSNGDLVVGYTSDKRLNIWDLRIDNNEPLKKVIQTNEIFFCLKILKNNDIAICQSHNPERNFNVIIRDPISGSIKLRLVGHINLVTSVIQLDNGYIASASCDNTIKIWNSVNGGLIKTFTNPSMCFSIAVLKNGNLAVGSRDSYIYILDYNTGVVIRKIGGYTGSISSTYCLLVLNNGYVVSCAEKSLRVWNPYNGFVEKTLSSERYNFSQISMLSNGFILAVSSAQIFIWS